MSQKRKQLWRRRQQINKVKCRIIDEILKGEFVVYGFDGRKHCHIYLWDTKAHVMKLAPEGSVIFRWKVALFDENRLQFVEYIPAEQLLELVEANWDRRAR